MLYWGEELVEEVEVAEDDDARRSLIVSLY